MKITTSLAQMEKHAEFNDNQLHKKATQIYLETAAALETRLPLLFQATFDTLFEYVKQTE